MSRTIDEKIVEMRFDNRKFEENVKTSMSTIDKLKSKLNFDGASKGFENVSRASEKVDFSGLGGALDTIKVKFGALETIAITALSNITNRAVDAGIELVRSLSVDNIAKGWGSYEQMMLSQQTIMSAVAGKINKLTGKEYDMADIEKEISDLAWYSDETSYNLDQMTNAVGNFTGSGMDLVDSKKTIIGISNACADAGIGASKAQSAFEGFSKAIGSGFLSLGVWNMQLKTSGITNSEKFRKSLIEAAAEVGTLVKKGDKYYLAGEKIEEENEVNISNLTEHLTKGKWATTEVLQKVFDSYSDTFDALNAMVNGIEDLDLSTDVFDDLNKAMKKQGKTLSDLGLDVEYDQASEAIAALTDAYKELGLEVPKSLSAMMHAQEAISFSQVIEATQTAVISAWSKTYQIIFGNYEEAKKLWTDLSEEMYTIFVEGINERNEMLKEWKDLGGSFDLFNKDESEGPLGALYNIIYAIEELLQPIKDAFHEIFPPMEAERLKKITEAIRDFTAKLRISDETAEKLKDAFKGVFSILKIVKTAIGAVFKVLKPIIGIGFKILKLILSGAAVFGRIITKISELIHNSEIFGKVAEFIVNIFKSLGKAFISFGALIKEKFGFPDFQKIKDGVSALLSKLREKIKMPDFAAMNKQFDEFLKKVRDKVVSPGLDKIKEAIDWLIEKIPIVKQKLVDFYYIAKDKIKKIAEIISTLFIKIKNKVIDLINWIKGSEEGFEELKDAAVKKMGIIGIVVDKIKKKMKEMALSAAEGTKDLPSKFERIKAKIKEIFEVVANSKFGQTVKAIWNYLKEFFINIMNSIKKMSFQDFVDAFLAVGKALAGIGLFNFIKKLKGGFESLEDLRDSVIGILDGIKGVLTGYQRDLNAKALLKIAGAVGILTLAVMFLGQMDDAVLDKAVNTLATIAAILTAVMVLSNKLTKSSETGMLFNFGDKTFSKTGNKAGSTILAMAAAILILAVAIKKLSDCMGDDPVSVISSAIVVLVMMKALSITMKDMGSVEFKGKEMKKSLLAMALAINILASTVKKLAKLDQGKMWSAVAAILLMMGALVGAMYLFNKFSSFAPKITQKGENSINPFVKTLIALSAAIMIMAMAVKKLTKLDQGKMWSAVAAIIVLTATLVGSMAIMQKFENTKDLIKFGQTMLIMAAALYVLSMVVKRFAKMELSDLAVGFGSIAAGMLLMVGAMFAMSKIKGMDGGTIKDACVGMLAMAAAMVVMSIAVKKFGEMDLASVLLGIGAIAGIFAVVIGATLLFNKLHLDKTFMTLGKGMALIGAGLLALGAGLWLFSMALLTFAGASAAVEAGALALVAALSALILGIIALLPKIVGALGEAAAMMVISFVQSFVDSLVTMGPYVTKALAVVKDVLIAAIPVIIDVIKELLRVLSLKIGPIIDYICVIIIKIMDGLAQRMPELIKSAFNLIGSIIEGIIEAAKELDPNLFVNMVKTFTSIKKIMTEADKLKDIAKGALKGIAFAALAAAELIVFMAVFGAISQIPGLSWIINEGSSMLSPKLFSDFSRIFESTGKIMKAADKIKDLGKGALQGVAVAALVIAEIAGIIAIFGALRQIPGLQWLIDEGGEFLESIGNAIGKAIGGLVGGFLGAAADGLRAIADTFVYFMDGISSFLASIAMIDKSVLESALMLGEILLIFTAAELINGIAGWLLGEASMKDFAEELSSMAPALVDFAQQVQGINGDDLKVAAEAGMMLAQLAGSLPRQGGVLQDVIGEVKSLTEFAEELTAFAPAIKSYSDIVSADGGIDENAVQASANAASMMSDFASSLPREGGVFQILFGEVKSLTKFAKELIDFAPAIVEYSKTVSADGAINEEAVKSSTNAAQMIADFANTLPREGGALNWLIGERKDLTKFGEEMVAFAPYFVAYSDTIKDVDSDIVEKSTNLASTIVSIAERLGQIDNGWSSSGIDIDDFGEMLEDFGTSMVKYYDSIKGISSFSTIINSTTAADGLVSIAETLGKIENQNDYFKTFVDALPDYGKNLKDYYDNISGITDFETITNSASAASAIAGIVNTLSGIEVKDNSASLAGAFEGLPTLGSNLAGYAKAIEGLKKTDFVFVNLSASGAKGMAEIAGILNTIEDPKNEIKNFGEGFESFGTNFNDYATAIKGLTKNDFDTVTDSLDAAKTFVDIIKAVSEVSGIESISAAFSGSIPGLGTSLHSFYYNLIGGQTGSGFDQIKAIGAASTALKLAQTFKDISTENIDGDKIISFGTSLKDLGQGLFDYYENIKTLTERRQERINEATECLSGIVDLIVTMNQALITLSGNTTALSVLGNSMTALASDYASFYEGIYSYIDKTTSAERRIDNSRLGSVITNLKSIIDLGKTVTDDKIESLNKLGGAFLNLYSGVGIFFDWIGTNQKFNIQYIQRSFAPCITSLSQSIEKITEIDTGKLREFVDAMSNLGVNALDAFLDAFSSGTGKTLFEDAAKDVYKKTTEALNVYMTKSEMTGAVRSNVVTFTNIGKKGAGYFVLGFTTGLKDKEPDIYKAAYKSGEKVDKGFRDANQIQSPSKKAALDAVYFASGFINKLSALGNNFYMSAYEAGESAHNGLAESISKIAGIASGDIDFQPTIRPVLDLSDVERDSRVLNGMIFGDRTIDLARKNALSINDLYEYNNSVTVKNDDVVGAIKTLRADVNDMSKKMERLRVVMNTGALVGELVDPIDNELGKRMISRRRGN